VSTTLQDRYGGTIIRHGPNEDQFAPDPYAGKEEELRAKWELPQDRKLAVFTGTPRSHKGVKVLVDALCLEKGKDWDFVLVGPKDNEFASYARKKLPERSHLLGPHPYEQIPEVLSIADAIPIPQKETAFAAAQVPAKLLDAMAMARPSSRAASICENPVSPGSR
jgi:glycosyltransferase involved in cell wall biosynthesis